MLAPRVVTLYASYIESLEAGSRVGNSYVNAGDVLDPTISKQYEIGAKVEARWNANLAAFRLGVAPTSMSSAAGKRLVQDGITLYEGIEASADLHLNDALTVGGGVTWLDPTYDRLSPASAAQETVPPVPRAGAASCMPPTSCRGWTAWKRMRPCATTAMSDNTLKLPDYTLVNAGVGYRLLASGHW